MARELRCTWYGIAMRDLKGQIVELAGNRGVRTGRRRPGRRFAMVTLGVGVLAGAVCLARWTGVLGPPSADPTPPRESVLLRQRQGLEALIARAERGPLVPLTGDHAVVVIDERFVQSLLGAWLPAERVVAGSSSRWRRGWKARWDTCLSSSRPV